MPKLVYGLGAGFVYACGNKGSWRKVLPKVLETIDNDVLISNVDMTIDMIKVFYECLGRNRLMFDSGGFTLFKKESKMNDKEFIKECEKMKKRLIRNLHLAKFKYVFELDNEVYRYEEDLMSTKNYLRQEIFDITGQYPVPVWKPHQGFEYWKTLCESDRYTLLAIGGLAMTRSWHTMREEMKVMISYAREKGKQVHALGCANVETCKEILPDSIDYSIFQYAISLAQAKKENPHLEAYDDLKEHTMLWSLGRAKSRSYLYETFSIED